MAKSIGVKQVCEKVGACKRRRTFLPYSPELTVRHGGFRVSGNWSIPDLPFTIRSDDRVEHKGLLQETPVEQDGLASPRAHLKITPNNKYLES